MTAEQNYEKRKRKFKPFELINGILLAIFSLIAIYPLYYTLIGSFNAGQDYLAGGIYFWPREWSLSNYQVIFADGDLWSAYLVTVTRAIIGTITGLLFTSVVAYAMSRKELKFKKAFNLVNLFTMFFSGGLVPYYLIICGIGLYDSFWVYIIPSLYSVYNMLVIRSFFSGISEEIHESAVMDGAGEFRIWLFFYMPLSKPVLATIGLWLATGHWNGYFATMIYTTGGDLTTLQYYLLQMVKFGLMPTDIDLELINIVTAQTLSFAAIIVSLIPVLCMYPFIQKYFAKGVMLGALKE